MKLDRLLVVDDEESIRFVISSLLKEQGFDVTTAASAEEALSLLDGEPFALTFLDIVLPGRTGLELLDPIHERDPRTQIVVMTSHASTQTAIEALRKGAYDYIHKPFDLDDILAVTQRAIERNTLLKRNEELQAQHARQNVELRAVVRRLGSLNAAGVAMSGITTLRELLDVFVQLVSEELRADRVSLMLLNEAGTELSIAASRGLSEDIVGSTRVPIGSGVAGRAAKEGRVLYSDATLEEPVTTPAGHAGAAGPFMAVPISVSVPIRAHATVLGVLNVTNRVDRKAFSDGDASYLLTLAGQAAVAIERARHSERLQVAFEELKRTQDQLVATGRLKALGEMAAGVAHDFNNLLSGILSRAQLAQRQLALDAPPIATVQGYAAQIEALARQGAASVLRIQEFSRIRKDRPGQRARLDEVARLALSLTEPKWGAEARSQGIQIQVESRLEESSEVTGDPAELAQAVSNLIFNAVEAMPAGGRLALRTWTEDGAACLEVRDTGEGIRPELRVKVFEPFFSTKTQGQGLGLSVVYGIVTRLGGRIEVQSAEGGGTRMILRFPLPGPVETAATSPVPKKEPIPLASARRFRVLLVDDEEVNRQACRDCLEFEGHTVRTAASGPEALETLDREGFDLVITDLSMPGLSGWDVARAVKQRSPKTPVMLLSGWGIQQAEADARAAGVDMVRPKPIGMDELLISVRQLLAA